MISHPHDATVCVKKISELAVVMIKHQHELSVRDAAHMIFDKWLDLEPLVVDSEVCVTVHHDDRTSKKNGEQL